MAFVHAGPRGMQAIARALEGLEMPENPPQPARFPDGWAPDIEAFRSGLDFSTVVFRDKEVFTDVPAGAVREPDLIAQVQRVDGQPELVLIHVEVEAQRDPLILKALEAIRK